MRKLADVNGIKMFEWKSIGVKFNLRLRFTEEYIRPASSPGLIIFRHT